MWLLSFESLWSHIRKILYHIVSLTLSCCCLCAFLLPSGGGCAPSPGGALGLGLASGVAGAATPNSSTNAASPELVNQRLKDMFRRNVEQVIRHDADAASTLTRARLEYCLIGALI
jgi:hypothetical protein